MPDKEAPQTAGQHWGAASAPAPASAQGECVGFMGLFAPSYDGSTVYVLNRPSVTTFLDSDGFSSLPAVVATQLHAILIAEDRIFSKQEMVKLSSELKKAAGSTARWTGSGSAIPTVPNPSSSPEKKTEMKSRPQETSEGFDSSSFDSTSSTDWDSDESDEEGADAGVPKAVGATAQPRASFVAGMHELEQHTVPLLEAMIAEEPEEEVADTSTTAALLTLMSGGTLVADAPVDETIVRNASDVSWTTIQPATNGSVPTLDPSSSSTKKTRKKAKKDAGQLPPVIMNPTHFYPPPGGAEGTSDFLQSAHRK